MFPTALNPFPACKSALWLWLEPNRNLPQTLFRLKTAKLSLLAQCRTPKIGPDRPHARFGGLKTLFLVLLSF